MDILKAVAGVTVCGICSTAFGDTSAQRIYHDIDRAEQLYNRKQTDGYINCNGCAESSIAAALGGITVAAAGMAGIAGMAGVAGVTAGETQLCIQRNCFPLRNDERSALGCGILELIGYGGHICLGRAEERYAQMMAAGGINRPDKTAVGAAKLQCIIEYIFQLDIPAALLQRIWPFPQNFNAGQV